MLFLPQAKLFPEVIDLSADYMGVVPIVGADVPRQEAEDHDQAEDQPHRFGNAR